MTFLPWQQHRVLQQHVLLLFLLLLQALQQHEEVVVHRKPCDRVVGGAGYTVLSAATEKIRRALCLIPGISHTPQILGSKLKYSVDSSRRYLLIAFINTAEIQL